MFVAKFGRQARGNGDRDAYAYASGRAPTMLIIRRDESGRFAEIRVEISHTQRQLIDPRRPEGECPVPGPLRSDESFPDGRSKGSV